MGRMTIMWYHKNRYDMAHADELVDDTTAYDVEADFVGENDFASYIDEYGVKQSDEDGVGNITSRHVEPARTGTGITFN
jgi:hypothetical protein